MAIVHDDPSWHIRASEPEYTRNAGWLKIVKTDQPGVETTKREGSQGPQVKLKW